MTLKGPEGEDVRKLHAEINQIVNQRFNLTTLAITIFAGLGALMVNLGGSKGNLERSPFIAEILLSIMLFVIAMWSRILTKTLRTFTTYLSITGKSNWEHDWDLFRKNGSYAAYTKPQGMILLILNVLGFLFAGAIEIGQTEKMSIALAGMALFMLILTELLIFRLSFSDGSLKGLFISEAEIEARWGLLKRTEGSIDPTPNSGVDR